MATITIRFHKPEGVPMGVSPSRALTLSGFSLDSLAFSNNGVRYSADGGTWFYPWTTVTMVYSTPDVDLNDYSTARMF